MNKVKIIVEGLKNILASKTKFWRFLILLITLMLTSAIIGGLYLMLKDAI